MGPISKYLNLKGDVFVLVQNKMLAPQTRQVAAKIIAQFRGASWHLLQYCITKLVEDIRIPVA